MSLNAHAIRGINMFRIRAKDVGESDVRITTAAALTIAKADSGQERANSWAGVVLPDAN
jgi:hypothetical protein